MEAVICVMADWHYFHASLCWLFSVEPENTIFLACYNDMTCAAMTRWSAEKTPCFCNISRKISQELFQCGNDFLSLIGHPTLDSPLVRFHWLKCPIQMPRDIQYRNNGYFLHKPVYFTNTNANAIPVRRNPVNNMVHRCEKFSGLCGTFLVTLLSQWSN